MELRTYVELFVYEQTAIVDEAIEFDSIGISRASNPWGWPGSSNVTSGLSTSNITNTADSAIEDAHLTYNNNIVNITGWGWFRNRSATSVICGINIIGLFDIIELQSVHADVEFTLSGSTSTPPDNQYDGSTSSGQRVTSSAAPRSTGRIEYQAQRVSSDWAPNQYHIFTFLITGRL